MKYVRSLQDPQKQYSLGDAPINIGRSAQNTIVLSESVVSRFHSRIEEREGQTILTDLNSMWGTYVNGKRIQGEHALIHGDMFTIGSSQWQFFAESTSPVVAKPEPKDGYAFISYARIDSKIIDTLILRLKKSGYRVWVDRAGIAGGEHWRQEIVDAIENCTVFILALSPHSVRSENVRKEVDLADSAQRPILPIELQPIADLPAKLKYQLAGIQRINLATNFENGFRQLLDAIESGITPASAPWITSAQNIRKGMNPWITIFILILILFTCAALLNALFS
jgi:hypothetical protein